MIFTGCKPNIDRTGGVKSVTVSKAFDFAGESSRAKSEIISETV